MKASYQVIGLSAALAAAKADLAKGATRAMSRSLNEMKDGVRNQVLSAGMSPKLAKTWQGKVYPTSGKSLTPSAYVYSKAPNIIDAYARGVTIVAKAGRRLLAIPTDDCPVTGKGRALTPAEVERRYGRPLRFVPRSSAQGSRIKGRAVAYLIMENLVRRNTGKFRKASIRELSGRRTATAKKVDSVVMFDLVASVRVPKKLDPAAVLNEAAAGLPSKLAQEWG